MADSCIPNKCNSCGLRIVEYFHTEASVQASDQMFGEAHELKRVGIISTVPRRRVTPGFTPPDFGSTSFCAVNSPAWSNPQQKCSSWTLKKPGMTISDYVTIDQAEKHSLASTWITIVGIIAAFIIAIVQAS